jgi:hypothetical protein
MKTKSIAAIILVLLFGCSFPLAYLAYSTLPNFTLVQGAGSFLFWSSLVGLVFLFPLAYVGRLFVKYIKKARGLLLFTSYLSVHLVLYGLILEGIIAYSLKIAPSVTQPSASIGSVPLFPVSAAAILAGLGFNPSVDLFIPPVFVLALSFYTISVSLVIAVLVLTNVMKVVEIGKMCGRALKSRSLVILPALGVIGGAACCLSLPILLSLAGPATAVISNNSDVWYGAYFIFPAATAVGLKYNMDSTERIASKMTKIVTAKTVPKPAPQLEPDQKTVG